MNISQETKMQVNRYIINNFPNRGYVGYVYAKRMLEVAFESYKQEGCIGSLTITDLMQAAEIKVTYQACRNAIRYFLKIANIEGSFSDFLINAIEQIIEDEDNYTIKSQEQGEDF